jgi:phosphatidylinositol-3,4,5-trisphosphate 3-phosphatase/dual-specificity protein phosphatase PTEN
MDILRKIVASPRARHEEANLDLCYVTANLIATSGPSGSYPQIVYRNPLSQLVKFLDSKHGENWSIWEFRAEGTGYPDEDVYNRIRHYPWPDHHPPPFALVPLMMASMRDWMKGNDDRVCVVHCKAGKGRSGTVSCSYLISEEGWTAADAMQRFTEKRMRPGFGAGISIPSQVRWVGYVDRWTKGNKLYVERQVEVLEVHVWGLRDGVKIAVEGYVDEGKVIKNFHTFTKSEREIVKGKISKEHGFADVAMEMMGKKEKDSNTQDANKENAEQIKTAEKVDSDVFPSSNGDVIFRPATRVVLPSSDINIDFERRNNSKYGGFTMVTSVAHVWFNTYFEGHGPEQIGKADDSGVFEIEFDAMDGIKGSSRKGTRAFDKMSVVWKAVASESPGVVITEPKEGEVVPQARPADWKKGNDEKSEDFEKKLGMREATSESADVSRASSVRTDATVESEKNKDEFEGVRPFVEGKSDESVRRQATTNSENEPPARTVPATAASNAHVNAAANQLGETKLTSFNPEHSLAPSTGSEIRSSQDAAHPSTADLPDGRPEDQMPSHHDHTLGSMKLSKNVDSSS